MNINGLTLVHIQETVTRLETSLKMFRIAEAALLRLKTSAPASNGTQATARTTTTPRRKRHDTKGLTLNVLAASKVPLTIKGIHRGLSGRRITMPALYTALSDLTKDKRVTRVATGTYTAA